MASIRGGEKALSVGGDVPVRVSFTLSDLQRKFTNQKVKEKMASANDRDGQAEFIGARLADILGAAGVTDVPEASEKEVQMIDQCGRVVNRISVGRALDPMDGAILAWECNGKPIKEIKSGQGGAAPALQVVVPGLLAVGWVPAEVARLEVAAAAARTPPPAVGPTPGPTPRGPASSSSPGGGGRPGRGADELLLGLAPAAPSPAAAAAAAGRRGGGGGKGPGNGRPLPALPRSRSPSKPRLRTRGSSLESSAGGGGGGGGGPSPGPGLGPLPGFGDAPGGGGGGGGGGGAGRSPSLSPARRGFWPGRGASRSPSPAPRRPTLGRGAAAPKRSRGGGGGGAPGADPEERSRRRLAAFLQKTAQGDGGGGGGGGGGLGAAAMLPVNLPRSLEMAMHTKALFEANLGKGLWEDQVGSTLARPLDAALVHCPPGAAALADGAAPSLAGTEANPRPVGGGGDPTQGAGAGGGGTPLAGGPGGSGAEAGTESAGRPNQGEEGGGGVGAAAAAAPSLGSVVPVPPEDAAPAQAAAAAGRGARQAVFLERQAQAAAAEGDEARTLELLEAAALAIVAESRRPSREAAAFPYDPRAHGLARRVQRLARRFLGRREAAARHAQRCYRGHRVREARRRAGRVAEEGARYIQRLARRRRRVKDRAAARVQGGWRGKKARDFCRKLRNRLQASITVQKYVRRLLALRRLQWLRLMWDSSKLIQRNFRGWLCRWDRWRAILAIHREEARAATLILARARGALGRLSYRRRRRAALAAERARRAGEGAAAAAAAALAAQRARLYLRTEEGKLDLKLALGRLRAEDRRARAALEGRPAEEKDRHYLRQVFDMYDLDGSATIDAAELKELTRGLGVAMTDPELRLALAQMDEDRSGEVEFEEFYAWLARPGTNAGGGAQVALLRQYLKARRGLQALTGKDKADRARARLAQREARPAAAAARADFRRQHPPLPLRCAACREAFVLYSAYRAHFRPGSGGACGRTGARGDLFPGSPVCGAREQAARGAALRAWVRHEDERARARAAAGRAEAWARARFAAGAASPWAERLAAVAAAVGAELAGAEAAALVEEGRGPREVSKATIVRAFRAFDFDGGGSIDAYEFGHLVRALKLSLSEEEAQAALQAMDEDGTGEVELDEFMKWYRATTEGVPEGEGGGGDDDGAGFGADEEDSVGAGDSTPLKREGRKGYVKKKEKKREAGKGPRAHRVGGGALAGLRRAVGRDPKQQMLAGVALQEAQCLFIRWQALTAEKKEVALFRAREPPQFGWEPSRGWLREHGLEHLSEEHYAHRDKQLGDHLAEAEALLRKYEEQGAGAAAADRRGSGGGRQGPRFGLGGQARVYMMSESSEGSAGGGSGEADPAARERRELVRRMQAEMARFLATPEGRRALEEEAHRLRARQKIGALASPETAKDQLEYLFSLFDADGSGALDRKELVLLLREVGVSMSKAEVKALAAELAASGDGDGLVTLQELHAWYDEQGAQRRSLFTAGARRLIAGKNQYLHHARLEFMARARAEAQAGRVTLAMLDSPDPVPLIRDLRRAAQRGIVVAAAERTAARALRKELRTPAGHRRKQWALDRVAAHARLERLLLAACGAGPGADGDRRLVRWRSVFQLYDTDESGQIEEEELQRLMASLGMPCDRSETVFLLREMDKDGSGEIDFEEFHTFVSEPGALTNSLRKRKRARLAQLKHRARHLRPGGEVVGLANQILLNEARAQARESAKAALAQESRLEAEAAGLITARRESALGGQQVGNENPADDNATALGLGTKETETAQGTTGATVSGALARLTAEETRAVADAHRYARTHRGKRELAARKAALGTRWDELKAAARQGGPLAAGLETVPGVKPVDAAAGRFRFGCHKTPWDPLGLVDAEEAKYLVWRAAGCPRAGGGKNTVGGKVHPAALAELGFSSKSQFSLSPESAFDEDILLGTYLKALGEAREALGWRRAFVRMAKKSPSPGMVEEALENLIAELRTIGRQELENNTNKKAEIGGLERGSLLENSLEMSANNSFVGSLGRSQKGGASLTSVDNLRQEFVANSNAKRAMAGAETLAMAEMDDFLKTKSGKQQLKEELVAVRTLIREVEQERWLVARVTNPCWQVLAEADEPEKQRVSLAFAAFTEGGGRGPLAGVNRHELPFLLELLGFKQETVGEFAYHLSKHVGLLRPGTTDGAPLESRPGDDGQGGATTGRAAAARRARALHAKLEDATGAAPVLFEEVAELYERLRAAAGGGGPGAALRRAAAGPPPGGAGRAFERRLARCRVEGRARARARRALLRAEGEEEED